MQFKLFLILLMTGFRRCTSTLEDRVTLGSTISEHVPLIDDDELQLVKSTALSDNEKYTTWFLDAGSGGTSLEVDSTNEIHTEVLQYSSTTEMQTESTTSSQTTTTDGTSVDTGSGKTEVTSPSTTSTTEDAQKHVLPLSCIQTPCNSTQLVIQAKSLLLVPQGANITITCKTDQTTTQLQWYRTVDSNYHLMASTDKQNTLSLEFAVAELTDGGLYSCAHKGQYSCCRSELRLSVYAVPNYRKHLVIIGTVTLCILALCLLFTVWRNRWLRRYAEEFKKAKIAKDELLLPV